MMQVADGRWKKHDSVVSALIADGIVERGDKKTIPPCVYYSISAYGRTLALGNRNDV
jgi:hypothetical protein